MEYKNVSLTKRYPVVFVRNGARYKNGETVKVNICLAADFYKRGLIGTVSSELMADAKAAGIESLFQKGRR